MKPAAPEASRHSPAATTTTGRGTGNPRSTAHVICHLSAPGHEIFEFCLHPVPGAQDLAGQPAVEDPAEALLRPRDGQPCHEFPDAVVEGDAEGTHAVLGPLEVGGESG